MISGIRVGYEMNIELTTDVSAIPDLYFKYAILVARYQGRFVFVRHRERQTLELPAGHREPGERIRMTADRELREETGAMEFGSSPRLPCSVFRPMMRTASARTLLPVWCALPRSGPSDRSTRSFEIAEVKLCADLPENLTYPEIQPVLFRQVREWLAGHTITGQNRMPDVTMHGELGELL